MTLFLISIGIMGLCMLGMAVGVIIRNKTFTSCGCASMTFNGEKIRCPGCTEPEGESCAEKPA